MLLKITLRRKNSSLSHNNCDDNNDHNDKGKVISIDSNVGKESSVDDNESLTHASTNDGDGNYLITKDVTTPCNNQDGHKYGLNDSEATGHSSDDGSENYVDGNVSPSLADRNLLSAKNGSATHSCNDTINNVLDASEEQLLLGRTDSQYYTIHTLHSNNMHK